MINSAALSRPVRLRKKALRVHLGCSAQWRNERTKGVGVGWGKPRMLELVAEIMQKLTTRLDGRGLRIWGNRGSGARG